MISRRNVDHTGHQVEEEGRMKRMLVDRVEPIGDISAIAVESLHLIQPQRSDHGELGNIDFYFEAVDHTLHEVGSYHLADS